MNTIIAFFSIIGSSEVNVTLLVIILFIILGVSITMIKELEPTLPAAPYGFLAFLFLLYLIFAISCAYISHHKSAPKSWFTGLTVKEQQMFTDYFEKNKNGDLTIYQYEVIKHKYEKYVSEQKRKNASTQKELQLQHHEKQHDSIYREQQMKTLKENA